jgi:hypothetical protein
MAMPESMWNALKRPYARWRIQEKERMRRKLAQTAATRPQLLASFQM